TLTRLRAIPSNRAIHPLDPRGNTNMSEGPTDHSLYPNASGTIGAVMVFVDFSNAPAGTTSAAATGDHLLGNGQFQQLFRDQSYQRLILDVVVKSGLGWRRMPKPSTKYSFATYDSHRAYIADAAALFLLSEVKFSDYTFVYIVAPQ